MNDYDDVKRYDPKKRPRANAESNAAGERSSTSSSEFFASDEDVRRREENYLFRGYGAMLGTSEMLDFAEGEDSD